MSDEPGNSEFMTKKHERLLNIAKWAKVIGIILFILFGFKIFADCYSYFQTQFLYAGTSSTGIYLMIASRVIPDLAKGLAFGIGLLGISYGLNMIVETDLNYRLKNGEESND
jgi:hypothetical protein